VSFYVTTKVQQQSWFQIYLSEFILGSLHSVPLEIKDLCYQLTTSQSQSSGFCLTKEEALPKVNIGMGVNIRLLPKNTAFVETVSLSGLISGAL
jgi:hypothetical protein